MKTVNRNSTKINQSNTTKVDVIEDDKLTWRQKLQRRAKLLTYQALNYVPPFNYIYSDMNVIVNNVNNIAYAVTNIANSVSYLALELKSIRAVQNQIIEKINNQSLDTRLQLKSKKNDDANKPN